MLRIEHKENGDLKPMSNCMACNISIELDKPSAHHIHSNHWVCAVCYKYRIRVIVCPVCGNRIKRNKYLEKFYIEKYVHCKKCGKKILKQKVI